MAPCSTPPRSIKEVSDMIDTSLIVDAALRKSQMLLDSLLSLDLMHEETGFGLASPGADCEFDELDLEQPYAVEPPTHVCQQLAVPMPMEALKELTEELTEVFEQVKAWHSISERANLSSPRLVISNDHSLCSSLGSSVTSLDVSSFTSSFVRQTSDGIPAMTSRTVLCRPSLLPTCVGQMPMVSPRQALVPASTVSFRGGPQQVPGVVHQPQSLGSMNISQKMCSMNPAPNVGSMRLDQQPSVGSMRCFTLHPATATPHHHVLAAS